MLLKITNLIEKLEKQMKMISNTIKQNYLLQSKNDDLINKRSIVIKELNNLKENEKVYDEKIKNLLFENNALKKKISVLEWK